MTRKLKLVLITIAVLLVIAFGVFVLSSFSKNSAPEQFSQSREKGAVYSQEIVAQISDIGSNISQIQKLESENKLGSAVDLVMDQIRKNEEVRQKAITLTGELEKMTQTIPEITPKRAGESALVALSVETMLIQKLITYSELLNNLLLLTRERITDYSQNHQKINDAVDRINFETQEINRLNSQFLDEMKKFDGYF